MRLRARRYLPRDRERVLGRDRTGFDPVRQRRTLDEFEGERAHVLSGVRRTFFESVDAGDVWVVEGGEHLRLAFEACEALRIARNSSGRIFSATSR